LQLWLQTPQFIVVCVTHWLPQQSWPSAHAWPPQRHWPPEHISPARQRLPQAPQLLGSSSVWAQPLAQQVSPAPQMAPLQAQAPLAQASGAVHACPHAPQLALSLRVSTQSALLQQTSGKLQVPVPHGQLPVVEQLPSEQQSTFAMQPGMLPHLQVPPEQVSPGLQA
jgi:hypothetical protein